MEKLLNINSTPVLDELLTGELIGEFSKTIIDVLKCTSGSMKDNIMNKLVFTLTMLEDAREEYYNEMEKGGEA